MTTSGLSRLITGFKMLVRVLASDQPRLESPSGSRSAAALSGQQLALLDALSQEDGRLAKMYQGGMIALSGNENPENLAHAAHSFREIMEKMPEYKDLPLPDRTSLKNRVQELQKDWVVHLEQNIQGADGVDNAGPRALTFFKKCESFFLWFEKHHPQRKKSVAKMIRSLDPQGERLPSEIEELRVEEWDTCRDYFINVAHHRRDTTTEEMRKWTDVLERFLLDRLKPRTFEDQKNIADLINEAESE
jgi:hypothetical protein